MKIGFLAGYTEEIVEFAAQAGFGSLELGLWPGAGPGSAGPVADSIRQKGLEISALGHYPNNLDPDPAKRAESIDGIKNVIDIAVAMGVDVVCTFAGRVPDKSIEDNIPVFREVFAPLADYAEKRSVKIAFENCPMMHTFPFRGINIAYSPEAWELMFDAVPSAALGLEMDPSHLHWLGVDYVKAVRDFGSRIYHVHAKDTEIRRDKLSHQSIFGGSWWRYRIPGWGEVDWKLFISALHDVGYEGNLDIEHEDPVFSGERYREGLVLGLKHLSRFVE